jgi:uncharacterized protein YndB with AHSA1/START domain
MTIAPIVRTVSVKAPPAKAFDLFTRRMADWWPKRGTIGKLVHVDLVIEPFAGGAWFERDAEGTETKWGHVLAWEPPSRLLLAWQIDTAWRYNPDLVTEVELAFDPAEDGGTRVTLTHRDLERFGADAAQHIERLGSGWPVRLAGFATFAAEQVDTGEHVV